MNNIHTTNIVTIGKDDYRIVGRTVYVSRSGCTAFYTVDSDMPDHAIDAYKPVNFDRGNTDFPAAPEQKCYVL